MRDFPVFTTENGAASLVLSQIPYTQKAYIQIQSSQDGQALLRECIAFCEMAGANEIYASGHPICTAYPFHTQIWKLQADVKLIGDCDAALFPVTEETMDRWRTIYNEKVRYVPNGAYLTMQKAEEYCKSGDCYFIHREGKLLGIGKASADRIEWVASVQKGAGEVIVRALCHALSSDMVCLEVASENRKALSLYDRMGFVKTALISEWYRVK